MVRFGGEEGAAVVSLGEKNFVVKALNKIMKMSIFGLFDAFIVQHFVHM